MRVIGGKGELRFDQQVCRFFGADLLTLGIRETLTQLLGLMIKRSQTHCQGYEQLQLDRRAHEVCHAVCSGATDDVNMHAGPQQQSQQILRVQLHDPFQEMSVFHFEPDLEAMQVKMQQTQLEQPQ